MDALFRVGTAGGQGTTCALAQLSAHPGNVSYHAESCLPRSASAFRLWHLPFCLCLLLLASCSTKQIQTSQETAETAISYINQAEAVLTLFQDNYNSALELFVDDQEKASRICTEIDPILVKAQAALASAKIFATAYASTPLPTTWTEFKTNYQACCTLLVTAGIELAKLIKEFQG